MIKSEKEYQLEYNDDNQIIIPTNMIDLQDFLYILWIRIHENKEKQLHEAYNKGAKIYNTNAGAKIMSMLN